MLKKKNYSVQIFVTTFTLVVFAQQDYKPRTKNQISVSIRRRGESDTVAH